MGYEEYSGTYQDHWTYQGEPGEQICEDTSNGEYETKGIYEKNEDARDGNNNSSPALFSEEEIHGRGRGLVAKVKLDKPYLVGMGISKRKVTKTATKNVFSAL